MVDKITYYNSHTSDKYSNWWLEEDVNIFQQVFSICKHIKSNQASRRRNLSLFAQLYLDRKLTGISPSDFSSLATETKEYSSRVSYNVIRSCIDTSASKIAKNKPRPLFLTERGDWSLQRKAKLLTQYLEGAFDSIGTGIGDLRTMYGLGRRAFVDSGIFGLGAVKFFKSNGEVKCERVPCWELLIDDIEGMHENPRQLHQSKLIARELVAEMFPKYRDKIEMASPGTEGETRLSDSTADLIEVIESWHLPSGPNAKDGKHAISIENCTLFAEEYNRDKFPFVFLRWQNSITGFWGIGIAEELFGIQMEIKKTLAKIQQALHLIAVPQIWYNVADIAHVNKHSNAMAGKYFYTSNPPTFLNPQAMGVEVYNWLETLYNRAFELVGISQLSAQSRKPSGLDSGVALREYQDIESERFQLVGQRYEDFYMDCARMIIQLTREIDQDGGDIAVKVKDSNFMRMIKWKDVDLDDSKYTLRVFPAGALPSTPAGKLQTIQELIQGGFFTKEEGFEYLDMPDLKTASNTYLAERDAVKRLVEKMLEDNEPATPDPLMNLDFCISWAKSQFNKGIAEDMDQDKLLLLSDFIKNCIELQNSALPPMPMGQDQLMATGQPGEPPVADLMAIPQQTT